MLMGDYILSSLILLRILATVLIEEVEIVESDETKAGNFFWL